MELDEFKQRLKETVPEGSAIRSAHELGSYTRRRAASIVKKIKRSILFELVACTVFIAVSIVVWAFYPVSYVRVFCVLSIFLCCFLLIYLGALYKKISAYEKEAPAVRESLQLVIGIVAQFTKLYFQFTMITLPIAFIFGLITGFLSLNSSAGGIKHFNWQRSIFFYTCWFIFWSAVMYFFSKWYIKKLYGNYLQQLNEQLKDIENG
jgi:hypothetical protein